jgi:rhodanese-related sulfurtransferase
MCRTGRRAELAKQILAPHSEIEKLKVYKWGIIEYKKEFPDQIEAGKINLFIPIMRQVQIAAGGLILVFSTLGFIIHPSFFFGSTGVGLGLFYAWLSGNCMMAIMLWKMPFNK